MLCSTSLFFANRKSRKPREQDNKAHLVLDGEDGQVREAPDGEVGVQVRERAQEEPRQRQVVRDLHLLRALALSGGDEVLLKAESQAAQLWNGRRRQNDREYVSLVGSGLVRLLLLFL